MKRDLDALCLSALEHNGTIYLSKQSLSLLPCIKKRIRECYAVGISREDIDNILKLYK